MDNVVALPLRGKTYLSGPNRTPDTTSTSTVALQGIVKVFKAINYNSTVGNAVKDVFGGTDVVCQLVRNSSGISLLPGRICVWKSTKQGKEVDGYTTLDFDKPAGIVDDMLPTTGVANNDYFWLVRKGPCLVKKSLDANALNKDDYVVAITAATSQATTAGRIFSIALANNATSNTSIALNRLGIAMSTSATTDANVLVYLDLY